MCAGWLSQSRGHVENQEKALEHEHLQRSRQE